MELAEGYDLITLCCKIPSYCHPSTQRGQHEHLDESWVVALVVILREDVHFPPTSIF